MKKFLAVSMIAALGLSGIASAGGFPDSMSIAPITDSFDNGIYLGAQGGWGINHWKDIQGVPGVTDGGYKVTSDNGAIVRGFLGFDINRFFALEAGYTRFFKKTRFERNTTKLDEVKTAAADLMFKGKLPVFDNTDLYAKFGASYLMSSFEVSDNEDHLNVAYGIGADYCITPNIIANVE